VATDDLLANNYNIDQHIQDSVNQLQTTASSGVQKIQGAVGGTQSNADALKQVTQNIQSAQNKVTEATKAIQDQISSATKVAQSAQDAVSDFPLQSLYPL